MPSVSARRPPTAKAAAALLAVLAAVYPLSSGPPRLPPIRSDTPLPPRKNFAASSSKLPTLRRAEICCTVILENDRVK